MLPFLLAEALAAPPEPTCDPLILAGTVPVDGAVVPPDAVFTAVAENLRPPCWAPGLELGDEVGALVPAEVEALDPWAWRLVPLAPLVPGARYAFRVMDPYAGLPTASQWVTVGEAGGPPVDPAWSFSTEADCFFGRATLTSTLRLAEPTSGLFHVGYAVDGEEIGRWIPVDGESVVQDVQDVRGGVHACASAELRDVSGEVVWSVAEDCAPELHCPGYGPPEAVELEMTPICDGPPSTQVTGRITLPPAEPDASASLFADVTTELGSQGTPFGLALEGPTEVVDLDLVVLGEREVCLTLRMVGKLGEELWRDGPRCNEEPLTCPGEARDPEAEPAGCGCGTPGARGPWAVLIALCSGLAVRRRATPPPPGARRAARARSPAAPASATVGR